jgi:hypothetical protein
MNNLLKDIDQYRPTEDDKIKKLFSTMQPSEKQVEVTAKQLNVKMDSPAAEAQSKPAMERLNSQQIADSRNSSFGEKGSSEKSGGAMKLTGTLTLKTDNQVDIEANGMGAAPGG